MKKVSNAIEYKLKGLVTEATEKEIKVEITKKDSTEEDKLDVQEFCNAIVEFCKENMDKNIELVCSIKKTE